MDGRPNPRKKAPFSNYSCVVFDRGPLNQSRQEKINFLAFKCASSFSNLIRLVIDRGPTYIRPQVILLKKNEVLGCCVSIVLIQLAAICSVLLYLTSLKPVCNNRPNQKHILIAQM